MKRLIRNSVFETNSSSSHSLSLGSDENKEFVKDTILPDENGEVILKGGQFSWTWFKSNDALTKANYAVAQFLESPHVLNVICELIEEHTLAKVVVLADSDHYSDYYTYVDHDSIHILDSTKETLHDFIFNKNSWVFGGNDNEYSTHNFYDVPEYKGDVVINPTYTHMLVCSELPELKAHFKTKPNAGMLYDYFKTIKIRVWMSDSIHSYLKKGDIELNPATSYLDLNEDIIESRYDSNVTLTEITMYRRDIHSEILKLCNESFDGFDQLKHHEVYSLYSEIIKNKPNNYYKLSYEIIEIQ